jgi:hypothetical protein
MGIPKEDDCPAASFSSDSRIYVRRGAYRRRRCLDCLQRRSVHHETSRAEAKLATVLPFHADKLTR